MSGARLARFFSRLLSLLLFVFVLAARGQELPAEPRGSLTLEAAVRLALEKNPALRAVEDEAQAVRARVGQARAGWFPRLDFSQGFIRGNNPVYVFGTLLTQRRFMAANFALAALNTPTPIDNFQTRFDGAMQLFDFDRTRLRVQSARRVSTAADWRLEQARQDLVLDVLRAYYAVLLARENLAAARQALRAAEANEQRVATLEKAGLVVASDRLSARVFRAQMRERVVRAENGLDLARAALARQTGVEPAALGEPTEVFPEPAPSGRTLEQWEQAAVGGRPALRAAELERDAVASQRRLARADFNPRLGLYASFERDAERLGGPSGTNWTAGARLEFNLFAGGADRSRLAEAEARERQAAHQLEWFRSGVQLEVRQAYLDLAAAIERAAAARDAAAQANESLRIVENRYQAGLTTITELLRAQAAQLDAQTMFLATLHDGQAARAQLERAAGSLTPDSQPLHPPATGQKKGAE